MHPSNLIKNREVHLGKLSSSFEILTRHSTLLPQQRHIVAHLGTSPGPWLLLLGFRACVSAALPVQMSLMQHLK